MFELLAMVCLGLAWLVPNHYPPWTSFYNESCAALAVLLLVPAQGRRLWNQALPPAVWLVMVVATIPWLQWLAGRLAFSGDALVSSLYLVGLASSIAIGTLWARADARRAMELLCGSVVAAAGVSSVLALVQVLQVGGLGIWSLDAFSGMRAYANLAQPNNLATLLGLGLLGVLYFYERGHIGASGGGALTAVLVLGIALTQSRTALLFGPTVLVGLFLASRRGLAVRTSFWFVGAVILCQGALTWGWPALQGQLLLTAPGSLMARGTGNSMRLQMWQIFFDALSHSPWSGFGWLQAGEAQLLMADRPQPGELLMHCHNLFLDLLVWCGYPLGLLLSALVLYWYGSRALKVRGLEPVIALLAVTLFGIHAMLELPHHYAYFLIPVGLWIGQIESAVGGRGMMSGRWTFTPLLLGGIMTLAVWRNYAEVEEDFRLVRFENLKIGSLRAAQPAPDAPFLSSLTGLLRYSRTEPVAGMSEAQLASMEAVVKRYPYAASLQRWARALALNGKLAEAQLVFVRLRHIHGEIYYLRLRQDIRQRVAEGETGLQELAQSLPD